MLIGGVHMCFFGVQEACHTRCVIQVMLSPHCTLRSTWPFVLLPQELSPQCPPQCINPSPLTQQGRRSMFGLVSPPGQGWGAAEQCWGFLGGTHCAFLPPRNPARAGWGSFRYPPPRGWLQGALAVTKIC